ncbi:MAG: FAD-dependent oxidoreductase [Chloroflexi bacterium]|nr:FAD-dependent oxidoreductase [Chloroflexota bacterium]
MFEGNTEGLGLERVGVATERGYITVDGRMATNVPGVYAVGDVTGPPLLAHVAMAQGAVAAEAIAGGTPSPLVYEIMPRPVYSHPQVASIGITESEARERGLEVKVGRFPFRANGKALALADYEGLIKLVSDAGSGAILGAQMVGPECSELLGEISLAIALEATPGFRADRTHGLGFGFGGGRNMNVQDFAAHSLNSSIGCTCDCTFTGRPQMLMKPTAAVRSNSSPLSYVASAKSYRLRGDLRPTTVTVPLCSLRRAVPLT